MKSYGSFNLEVVVPEGVDAQHKANDILMLMREEVSDPSGFLSDLKDICKKIADFLECKLEFEEKDGKLLARFNFKTEE